MDATTIVLAILKAAGLVVAGVFGIVGAVTNFKDAAGRLTIWGRRNLAALVFGLAVSLTAQCIEYIRGHNEATAAAERANKAAEQAEVLLNRTKTAVDTITNVSRDVEQISRQASASANALARMNENVERGLDPMEPLKIGASFSLPLPAEIPKSTEHDDTRLLELINFRIKLDNAPNVENDDGDSLRGISLCRACPLFPPESNHLPQLLLTEAYEIYFAFYKKEAKGKGMAPKGEPYMAFWVQLTPEVDGAEDDADLAPEYVPKYNGIYFHFRSQVVKAGNIYSPRSTRYVHDLLGARMAIEFRTTKEGWLPQSVLRRASPFSIDWYLPGRRELQFDRRNLTRLQDRNGVVWIFDFPNTMEGLRRMFVP
jgi:hypothetical protein